MRFKALIIAGVIIMLMSCKNEYHRKVEKELATGIRHDTILLGLQFGMSSRQFFDHAWELNRKGLVQQGHSNSSILYILRRFDKEYEMNFYPTFVDDKIATLPIAFSYTSFAPWTPKFSIDTLFKEVAIMYKETYGDDFLEVKDPQGGMALVRVDGNRQLSIYKDIAKNNVTVLFKDLTVKKDETE